MVGPPNKHVNTIPQESKNGGTILFWDGVNVLFSLDYRVRKVIIGVVFISGGGEGGSLWELWGVKNAGGTMRIWKVKLRI